MTILFAILAAIFFMGKGSSLIQIYNTTGKEEKDKYKKLSRVIGMCFGIIDIFLIFTLIIWNNLPVWFTYVFIAIISVSIFVITFLSSIDIIFRKSNEQFE